MTRRVTDHDRQRRAAGELGHPVRCWLTPGHERCAVTHAALRAAMRADHAASRAKLLRAWLDDHIAGEPVERAVMDVALAELGVLVAGQDVTR